MYVVDASYIQKKFNQIGVIGKGKDFIHSKINSQIHLLERSNESKKQEWGTYALQIYENLSLDQFEIKVNQLQKVMFERITSLTTRLILLGKEETHSKTLNLYALYEMGKVDPGFPTLLEKDALEEVQAKRLLEALCLNFQLQARHTNEFLDISPQNIFLSNNGEDFIISNFGLTFQGSKFHRTYIPSTDPFFKQITLQNVYYSYSFMAALVTLLAMTKIDAKDLFFDDGQFKANLLRNILDNLGDEKQTKEQLLGKLPLTNKKIALPYKYSKEFLQLFLQLLSIPTAPRSVFQQLVTHPENILELPCPYFDEKDGTYSGQIHQEDTIPNGNGAGIVDGDFHSGVFDEGILTHFTTKCANNKYILQGLQNKETWVFDGKGVQIKGSFNDMFNAEGIAVVLVCNKLKPKKQTMIYMKGQFTDGQLTEGKSFQQDKSVFAGTFEDNQPQEGEMIYQKSGNRFSGKLQNFMKIEGKLKIGDQEFDGTFVNDQVYDGSLSYKDGSIYQGKFKNGERNGFGAYEFPINDIRYVGEFKDDYMHGEGILIDTKSREEVKVSYVKGRCTTDDLPPQIQKTLQQIKEMKLKNSDKIQQMEGIQEEIEENLADQDEDNYDMQEDDEDV